MIVASSLTRRDFLVGSAAGTGAFALFGMAGRATVPEPSAERAKSGPRFALPDTSLLQASVWQPPHLMSAPWRPLPITAWSWQAATSGLPATMTAGAV